MKRFRFVAGVVTVVFWSFCGALQAAVVPESEPNNTAPTADAMAFFDDYTGAIASGDADFVGFVAAGGETISAFTGLGTLSDSTLQLLNTDGTTQLAFNDDAGGTLQSQIVFTLPPVAGTYFLAVRGFGGATGSYELYLRIVRDVGCDGPCVVTDRQTLAGLTVDSTIGCALTLGSYCTGGDPHRGEAPHPDDINFPCGLSFRATAETNSAVLNSLNHHYLQSTVTPKVVDFGVPVNTAFVFPAVDHGPFPEEGIESTVWGSNVCDISNFPTGWTLGTLTRIYADGWVDAGCAVGEEADDFAGQYSFFGTGFRYIAVHANFSISIFDDPSHTTSSPEADDDGTASGWQSHDDEIDAIGTPICAAGAVVADAGPDQTAEIGQQACFDASNSSGTDITFAWDLNGDGSIDATGPTACVDCADCTTATATLFVTDSCGCVASDTVNYECCTRPMITCPSELIVRCTTPDGFPADALEIDILSEPDPEMDDFGDEPEIEVVVTDLCDMDVTVTDNRPADFYPSSCGNDRPTVLTFTARTDCGFEATCQTRVFVYGPMCCPGFVDEELTLLPADVDLRQETNGPTITKGNFDIWNQDEVRFSGTHRCVNCWDSELLSLYSAPNHFLRGMIHTDKGHARVDGLESNVCPGSVESPMVGVLLKEISFFGRLTDILRSAITPVGTGSESAQIRYDIIAPQNALAENAETPKRRNAETSEPGAQATGPAPVDRSPAAPTGTVAGINPGGRGDITRKGSLLIWPKVQVRWNAAGELIEDTFLDLANDFSEAVDVQLYLVNGDGPLDAECTADCRLAYGAECINHPVCIAERAHPGWNKSDVQLTLTANQPTYWSAFTGQPAGVSSFEVLDPGNPPGRPDLDPRNPGGRVIRGFVMGWAVNAEGHEICWNHLVGDALLIHYRDSSAAEYNAWAFQCVADVEPGVEPDGTPGQLNLDGVEYENVPDALIFDFYAVGSSALSHPSVRGLRRP